MKFSRRDLSAVLPHAKHGDHVVLTLTGALHDGTAIEARDCVVVAGAPAQSSAGCGHTETMTTDASGDYSFVGFDGTYTLSIDATTGATDFNETLAANFDAESAVSANVTVGPDSRGNEVKGAVRLLHQPNMTLPGYTNTRQMVLLQ